MKINVHVIKAYTKIYISNDSVQLLQIVFLHNNTTDITNTSINAM